MRREGVRKRFASRMVGRWSGGWRGALGLIIAIPLSASAQNTTTPETDAPAAKASSPAEKTVPPREIKLAEAREHLGERCVVTLRVESSSFLGGKWICFLNSARDHRDADNFSVVIMGKESLDKFLEAELPEPHVTYKDKTIRVTGEVTEHRGKPQIRVASPDQIELVDEADETVDPPAAKPR